MKYNFLIVPFIFLIVIISASHCFSIGQNPNSENFLDIADAALKSNNYSKAIEYYKNAIKSCTDNKDFECEAYCFYNIGKASKKLSQYDNSISYFNKAFIIYQKENFKKEAFYCTDEIGWLYSQLNKFDKSAESYIKASYYAEKLQEYKLLSESYLKVGISYSNYGNYNEALNWLGKSEKVAKEKDFADLLKQVVLNKEKVKNNINSKEKIITKFDQSEKEEKEKYINYLDEKKNEAQILHKKSLDEISELSVENQAKEYKLRVMQEINEKQILGNKMLSQQNQIKEKNLKLIKQDNLLQKEKNEKKNKIILGTIVIIAFFLILLIIIFWLYKQRLKTLKILAENNDLLSHQKEEIIKQKEEIEKVKQKADEIIINMLPPDDGRKMLLPGSTNLEHYHMASLLFTETEKERMRLQLESLKGEINPHFLYNSFNFLMGVIEENQNLASNYIHQLTIVYKYILETKNLELIELEKEINFIQSYCVLLQNRFGSNFTLNNKISNEFFDSKIPPMTLHTLIENAFKHNIVSEKSPLIIDIYIENNCLIISNSLQRKKSVFSNNTGLKNLKDRYLFLLNVSIDVCETKEKFVVKMPLKANTNL